jgi:transposase-like protein
MMFERGIRVSYTTIYRWVIEYTPILEVQIRKNLKMTNDSWRLDETYIKVRGKWHFLYRAVDKEVNTIDYYLSKTRNVSAAKKFLNKALGSKHNIKPRVITTDKYAATIKAIKTSPEYEDVKHRNSKYLNNIIEQDHRQIKRKTNSILGFKSFDTAVITIAGIEVFQMIKKNQIEKIKTVQQEVKFVEQLFMVG